MSTELQRYYQNVPPASLDEGYWSALLSDDEFATSSRDLTQRRPDDGNDVFQDDNGVGGDTTGSDWAEIQRITDNDQTVELKVVSCNRGGLLVEWRSLRGFVPASQLIDFPPGSSSNGTGHGFSVATFSMDGHTVARRKSLVSYIGRTLQLRVIELNVEKNRLILSERAAQAQPGERGSILSNLQSGNIVSGVVTNLCDFGAFVDLGGLEGLIHISELSWGRVGHPEHLLTRGQTISVYVLDVDRYAARIALSLKRLRPDPWKTVHERYSVGQVVEGIVTNVVDFGAFACIEEGLEGLIHGSELAEGHFLHPRNVVNEGHQVRARILSIDGQARRLGLSLRLTP